MKKYILCCFVIFLSFCFTKIVFADIEISEIMYDVPNSIGADAGNEWLELYNNGSDPVTIKGGSSGTDSWRIYQESSTQTINNRTFATTSYQGGMTIDPGKYAVVTESGENFLKNYAFDGDIFVVSAMSLTNNTQEQGSQKIGLRLGSSGTPWSVVQYDSDMGAKGDGNSLQLIDGTWKGASPTPGVAPVLDSNNDTNSNDNSNDTSDSSDSSSHDTTPVIKNKVYPISTKIIADTKSVAGIPIQFSNTTTGEDGQIEFSGIWSWNFGDGTVREDRKNPIKFTHTYLYPGSYVVTLEYRDSVFDVDPDATGTLTIVILNPQVIISNVLYDNHGGIELSNTSGIDIDLSGWHFVSAGSEYVFPPNSIILNNKKVMYAGVLLGLSIARGQSVYLHYPDGTTSSVFPQSPIVKSYSYVKPANISVSTTEIATPENSNQVVANLVQASASQGVPLSDTKSGSTDNPWSWYIFGGVVVAGSAGVVAFRRKQRKKTGLAAEAEEFEIVE